MNRFSQLENMLNDVKDDFSKFYEKSNKAAGTRVRNSMQAMKILAQEIRLEVQNMKNAEAAPVAAPAKKPAAKKAAPAPAKKAPAKKK